MNRLVKLHTRDDGDPTEDDTWHLIFFDAGGNTAFCTGEFFGEGESGCEYEEKQVARGGVDCKQCIEKIKRIKSFKF